MVVDAVAERPAWAPGVLGRFISELVPPLDARACTAAAMPLVATRAAVAGRTPRSFSTGDA